MIKSVICDILGIRYPVFQGGMAWIADSALAAAVSEAGGLGLISAVNYGREAVREEIRKARALTDKPFGVNVNHYTDAQLEKWKHVIDYVDLDTTIVNIDGYVGGIGSNSCGPLPEKKYLIPKGKLNYKFVISPKSRR